MEEQKANLTTEREGNRFTAHWTLFWVALGVRLFFLTVGQLYVLHTWADHVAFGSEAGHIARALLTGRGYSDPFWWGKSGPTAWLAPGYPLLLAGIFKIFGIYTLQSAWVTLATQCAFNAAAARWIWEIGARCFGERTGRWAGWIWALSPWAMMYAVVLPWETSISTAIFTWAFVLTLRLRGVGEDKPGYTWTLWAAWGATWGAVALFNPSLLLFLPCAGIWLLMSKPTVEPSLTTAAEAFPGPQEVPAAQTRTSWQFPRKLTGAVLAATIFVAMMAPWWARNYRVFHKFIPARGNLGVELCSGNCYGIAGVIGQWDHPNLGMHQMDKYRNEGEVAYDHERMETFKQVVRQRPLEFVEMTLLRMDFFWFGVQKSVDGPVVNGLTTLMYSLATVAGFWGVFVAWRRKIEGAALFAMAFLTIPVLYYVVATQERFRHPLEPLLCVLSVYAVVCAEKSWRVNWFRHRETDLTDFSMPWAQVECRRASGRKAA